MNGRSAKGGRFAYKQCRFNRMGDSGQAMTAGWVELLLIHVGVQLMAERSVQNTIGMCLTRTSYCRLPRYSPI
jgi:hypothetical protein